MKNRELATNPFVRRYDLATARGLAENVRKPRDHQEKALKALRAWISPALTEGAPRGGLLVLPTGGGKTFTAVRFLCEWPLSEGYKVLWLAHTHHLLEQAFETFGGADRDDGRPLEVSRIRPPRASLTLRVVSSMPGHARVASIDPKDDVLIGTVQTLAGAQRDDHGAFEAWVAAARGKLAVVFDEAHHAPAPSFARFLQGLSHRVPGLVLLGLTATPVYDDKLRKGWLRRFFPQGIVYQTTAGQLMATGMLAKPIIEEAHTKITPTFDEKTFARFTRSFADLPSVIIESLAKHRERNDFIVQHYVDNRARFGRTLIFADRWDQCEYLREGLRRHGVKADVVYSHVDATPGSVEARNRRTADENTKVIRAFRKGSLDVLINIRMLTEGTDVPEVQTVFLTRQTTSRVLLTQMIGRALRGPAVGGTEEAYVVAFIDEWKHLIHWAEFRLDEGATDDRRLEARPRLPLNLVSIALLRALTAQMYAPADRRPATFLETVPVGWYAVDFEAQVEDSDDVVRIERLVLVYDRERMGFSALITAVAREDLTDFREPAFTFEEARPRLATWVAAHLGGSGDRLGGDLLEEVFAVVRHVAQAEGEAPAFYPFEERSKHDLDAFARDIFDHNLGRREVPQRVKAEYDRPDRYWRAVYGGLDLFRDQFELVSRRIENELLLGGQPSVSMSEIAENPERYTEAEPSLDTKAAVRQRDGVCLCCGSSHRLEVDHIVPMRHGGRHDLENLQALCGPCNRDKGVNEFNYRVQTSSLVGAHADFQPHRWPGSLDRRERGAWEACVRGTLNRYYRCAAVSRVEIGGRGPRFYEWLVELNPGNDPGLLEPHLQGYFRSVQRHRKKADPEAIVVAGTDAGGRRRTLRVSAEGVSTGETPSAARR